MNNSVLLDTSFFIRLLTPSDPLQANALAYYQYFLENDIILKTSTISIAEYCVLGKIDELPLRNIQIVAFNLDHAKQTGDFARIIFASKNKTKESLTPRAIIPNDSKLFAQAHIDETIKHFVTSDTRSQVTYSLLANHSKPSFEILDISIPYDEFFGVLDF